MEVNGGQFGVGVGVVHWVSVHVACNVAGGNVLLDVRWVGGGVMVQIIPIK